MTAHTPGPWHTDGGTILSEEAQANACLIAAAPDLLAALQRIVQLAGDDEHEPVMAWKDAFAAGAAAIAKAEGGE